MDTESDGHILRRWFSVGDLLSALITLVALGVTWGSLSTRLSQLQADVAELQARDITPGARSELARVSARVDAQDAELVAGRDDMRLIREEMREQRREIIEAISRLETKLDSHDKRP